MTDLQDVTVWARYYAPEPLKTKLLGVLTDFEAAESQLASLRSQMEDLRKRGLWPIKSNND